jgi:chemotaxis protein histidine kinase CheA
MRKAAPVDDTRVDGAAVRRQRDEFGAEIYAAALKQFWPQARTALHACERALDEPNGHGWQGPAHVIKGSAATMGFSTMSTLAAELQGCHDRVRARELLQTLHGALARTDKDYGGPLSTGSIGPTPGKS